MKCCCRPRRKKPGPMSDRCSTPGGRGQDDYDYDDGDHDDGDHDDGDDYCYVRSF